MNKLLLIFVILLLLSCQSLQERIVNYQGAMIEKNFSFEQVGECVDALEDTIHEQRVVYIVSETFSDTMVSSVFKFKDVCCHEFLGDYRIKGKELVFEFEQVNDEECSCICMYQYQVRFSDLRSKVEKISIKMR